MGWYDAGKSLSEPMVQQGNKKLNEKRSHPCHKPKLLYRKLIMDFAILGDKLLDTHGGDAMISIAADELGFDLDICEIDKEYFDKGVEAFNVYKMQLKLF
jgi:site-specific DNA-methyltransferase (adenine-specific)